jgi:ribosomal protein L37AE/L43A
MNHYHPRYYTERAETRAMAKAAPDTVAQPDRCPSCQGRVIDTLAKVITATTTWRCRGCEHTWSIATRNATSGFHR